MVDSPLLKIKSVRDMLAGRRAEAGLAKVAAGIARQRRKPR